MSPKAFIKPENQNYKEIDQSDNVNKNIPKVGQLMVSQTLRDNDYLDSSIEKQINMNSQAIPTFQNRILNKNIQEVIASPKPGLKFNSKTSITEEGSLCGFSNEYSEDATDFSFSMIPKIPNSNPTNNEEIISVTSKVNSSENQIKLLNNKLKRNLLPILKDSKQTTINPKIGEHFLPIFMKLESKTRLNNKGSSKRKIKYFRFTKNIDGETKKNENHPADFIFHNNYQNKTWRDSSVAKYRNPVSPKLSRFDSPMDQIL